jgi:folylpolyglutamate synthase/dihydropteroate synthase
LEQFWKEISSDMPGSFQLLEKEKPTILLDSAHNLDAVENLLLGIRLLHYQRPLKGLTLIIGASAGTLHSEAFTKMLRYFFKKTSGLLFICPLENPLPGSGEDVSWDVEAVAHDMKGLKIKTRACASFSEAFALAVKSVDERHGLVAVTGSRSIIQNYWQLQGMKKLV